MDEKTRDELVAGIERAFCAAGARDYEDGIGTVKRFVELVDNAIPFIETVDALRTTLDAAPEPSKKEMRAVRYAVKYMPNLLRFGIKALAKKALSTLPALPNGRPPALSAGETTKMLDYIAELHRKGTDLHVAKDRAAQRFDCSLRTVERLWSERDTEPEDKPTVSDVIDFLSEE